jgi:hypothetical protein
MMLGAKRKMFSLGSSRAADLDLFFDGVRLDGVDTEPFPLGESSLSSAARAAFCRRVRALIMKLCVGTWELKWVQGRLETCRSRFFIAGYLDCQLDAAKARQRSGIRK